MMKINQVRKELLKEYETFLNKEGKDEDYSTIELINVNVEADENFIVRKRNEDYCERELEWYNSQSLNVNNIPGETPKIWKQISDKSGNINSNYGWCIFSDNNYNQYNNCLKELMNKPESRRAVMIYTRPSMWEDAFTNGMQDFMCTNYVHCFIRNNTLIYIVYQRSCDAIFGFNNDHYWHDYVYQKLINDYFLHTNIELQKQNIQYNFGSLHVYPRHYNELNKLLISTINEE